KNTQLSKFVQLLEETGYDKEIVSSKTYTVWAPSNNAIDAVSDEILKDPAALKRFVGFHIANQSYFANKIHPDSVLRIVTLSGKALKFTRQQVEGVDLVEGDVLTSNGVFHVLSEPLVPKSNIWETYQDLSDGTIQKSYLQSLYGMVFN